MHNPDLGRKDATPKKARRTANGGNQASKHIGTTGTEKGKATTYTHQSYLRTFLQALPMMILSLMMLTGGGSLPKDPLAMIAFIVTFIFINTMFILMLHTGNTDRYRAIVFFTMAVLFSVSFISSLVEARGSMSLSVEEMLAGKTPFCHIVIPMVLIPAALTKTIIFPGTISGWMYSIGTMLVIWFGATLALGRGWCSWGCFYGGFDDGFSRFLKKPRLKNIDPRWRYLSFAVLLGIVLTAALTLAPTYCEWLCPYKTVTEFAKVTSFKILVQTIIFLSLFFGLVIVGPLLSKRRTQCGLFCPFGAFQSCFNVINPFHVVTDKEKCVNCKRCTQVCPTFALPAESLEKGHADFNCTKCGKCVDACPTGAIHYHIKGTPKEKNGRMFFLYPAYLFLLTFGGGMIANGLYRILSWIF